MERIITYILFAVAIYALIGIIFTLIFLPKGLTKVDDSAKGAGFMFKLLIFPGLVALWPLFLNKWIRS